MKLNNKTKGPLLAAAGVAAAFFSMYWFLTETAMAFTDLKDQYSYFTNQVSLLCGIYLLLTSAYCFGAQRLGKFIFNPYVKTAVLAYSLTVALGYYAGVLPFSLFTSEDLYLFAPQSIYCHFVNPLIITSVYFMTPFSRKPCTYGSAATALCMSIYPAVYLAFAEIEAVFSKFYVYPFLNPDVMGGYANVFLSSLAVLVFGIAFIFGICALSRSKQNGNAYRYLKSTGQTLYIPL